MNKYFDPKTFMFTQCRIEMKSTLQDYLTIAKKYRVKSPKLSIISQTKNGQLISSLYITFVNNPTKQGLQTLEEEIDSVISYLKSIQIIPLNVTFSHTIEQTYIDLE